MIGIEPDTSDISRLIRYLEGTIDNYVPQRQLRYMENVVVGIVDVMEVYIPETEANRPPAPYYSRGAGTIGAADQILYRSGQLKDNWEQNVTQSGRETIGEIRNSATGQHVGGGARVYPSYVHGTRTEQSWFHQRRGHKSLLAVSQQAVGEDTELVYQGIVVDDTPDDVANDIVNHIESF